MYDGVCATPWTKHSCNIEDVMFDQLKVCCNMTINDETNARRSDSYKEIKILVKRSFESCKKYIKFELVKDIESCSYSRPTRNGQIAEKKTKIWDRGVPDHTKYMQHWSRISSRKEK